MKHIAQINVEFLKEARKWEDLTLEEQKGYLSRHPRSKRKLTSKKTKVDKTKKKLKEKKIPTQNLRKFMPANTEVMGDQLSWSKRGGYAGEKSIAKFVDKIKAAGWEEYDSSQHSVPDGSVMGHGTSYISPDGKHIANTSKSYGSTASSNYYSISIKPVETETDSSEIFEQLNSKSPEEIEKIEKAALKSTAKEFKKLFKDYGVSDMSVGPDDEVNIRSSQDISFIPTDNVETFFKKEVTKKLK